MLANGCYPVTPYAKYRENSVRRKAPAAGFTDSPVTVRKHRGSIERDRNLGSKERFGARCNVTFTLQLLIGKMQNCSPIRRNVREMRISLPPTASHIG